MTSKCCVTVLKLVVGALLAALVIAASPALAAGTRAHATTRCELKTHYRHLGRRCGIVSPPATQARLITPSHLRVNWRVPTKRRTVSGDLVNHHCQARVTGRGIARVDFLVDHHRLNREYFAPYTCFVSTRHLRDGRHHLTVRAFDFHGHQVSRTILMHVENGPIDPTPTSPPLPSTWSDSFDSGNFDTQGWYHGQDESDYGHRAVVGAEDGVTPHTGSEMARFQTTPEDIAAGRIHAKLLKEWGSNVGHPDSRPPTDVSGTYSAWYYLPTTYAVPAQTWVNAFQFKEQHTVANGPAQSDPLWWVQFTGAAWAQRTASTWQEDVPSASRPDAPVAFLSHQDYDFSVKRHFLAVPLGRWFEIKAVVHQGDRTDFFLDGHLLDTAHASEYPVSPFHGATSTEWIWGVGNYSDAANGPLYVDDASFTQG